MQVLGDIAVISNIATVHGGPTDLGVADIGVADIGVSKIVTTEVARRQVDGRWLYLFDDPFFAS